MAAVNDGDNDPEPLTERIQQLQKQLATESERRSLAEDQAHASRQELIEVQKEMEKTEKMLEQEKSYSTTFKEESQAKEQVRCCHNFHWNFPGDPLHSCVELCCLTWRGPVGRDGWQELLTKLDKARKEADDNAARLEAELVSHRHTQSNICVHRGCLKHAKLRYAAPFQVQSTLVSNNRDGAGVSQ
jgi:hypothetical protein